MKLYNGEVTKDFKKSEIDVKEVRQEGKDKGEGVIKYVGCDEKNDPYCLGDRPSLQLLANEIDLVGVEIGVRFGCNALRILLNLNVKRLYLVDPYKPFPIIRGGLWMNGNQNICDQYRLVAMKNLEGYDNIIWREDFSYNVIGDIEDDLDFVYIDGDHRYEAVKKDIRLYLPKVKTGGILAGHDYTSTPDVTKAVDEIFGDTLIQEGDDWWIIKE
ncbi:MAG: class I SAM-dependent methyltransferase [Candidatus Hodarchaeales archaeon]|jgi:hypothetical protein